MHRIPSADASCTNVFKLCMPKQHSPKALRPQRQPFHADELQKNSPCQQSPRALKARMHCEPYIHTCIHIFKYVFPLVSRYIYICVCTHIHVHIHTHLYIPLRTYTYVCVCIYTHRDTRMYMSNQQYSRVWGYEKECCKI